LIPTKEQLQTGLRENQKGRAHREKALVRVDDKKELINPPRIQEKEFKEPEKISLSTAILALFLGASSAYKL